MTTLTLIQGYKNLLRENLVEGGRGGNQRRVQNPVKHLRWSVLRKYSNIKNKKFSQNTPS